MRSLNFGSSSQSPVICVYAPSPIRYSSIRPVLQTTKLATLRGRRARIKSPTKGSSMNAIMTAIVVVIKNTRAQ